jgi:hypothetical protein
MHRAGRLAFRSLPLELRDEGLIPEVPLLRGPVQVGASTLPSPSADEAAVLPNGLAPGPAEPGEDRGHGDTPAGLPREIDSVAAPPVRLGGLDQACPDGIQVEIPDQFEKVSVLLAEGAP